MLDPLASMILALCFTVLFILAGAHKLGSKARFRANLAAYQLLPASLVPVLASVIPLFEIFLGIAWASKLLPNIVPLLSAGLLLIYTLAIAINILRGRSHIDCGCSMSSSKSSSTQGEAQQLSTGLLFRNSILIIAAIIAGIPTSDRSLGIIDFFNIVVASIVLILLYTAFNQLLANRGAIGSWRRSNG